MKNNYVITPNNFNKFIDMVVAGTIKAESYSSECFSLSEVMRARDCRYVLEEIMERMFQKGYDPYLVKSILEKHGDSYIADQELSLKQNLDDDFRIDCSDLSAVIDYFYAVSEIETGGAFQ